MWILVVTYPSGLGFRIIDDKLFKAARRFSSGSGCGFGERDHSWYFKTKKGAENTSERIKALKIKGLKAKIYTQAEYCG